MGHRRPETDIVSIVSFNRDCSTTLTVCKVGTKSGSSDWKTCFLAFKNPCRNTFVNVI